MKSLLKKCLPLSLRQAMHSQLKSLRLILIPRIANSRFFTLMYYRFVSTAFNHEQTAVLSGINVYLKAQEGRYYQLVRNIHRLEKGLSMQPRKQVFGLDYIAETVQIFATQFDNADAYADQLVWAATVLERYFQEIHSDNEVLKNARALFLQAMRIKEVAVIEGKSPYNRGQETLPAVSYEALKALSIKRRSVRWYLPKPVSRDLIDNAIEIAALAPSACNRQPFEFRIYDETDLKNKVITIPGGTTGWSHSPPLVVALVGKLNAYTEEHDRHLIYIDASLSAMAFMYALESLGLSSCAINFPDTRLNRQGEKHTLHLKNHEKVIMLISVGYADPDGMIPYSQKKSIEQLRSYNAL